MATETSIDYFGDYGSSFKTQSKYQPTKTKNYSNSVNLSGNDNVPLRSINDKSTKASAISQKALWIIVIITISIVIIWAIFLILCYWHRKVFFNYVRPGTLPGQVGATIAPNATTKTYNFDPSEDLTNRAVFLGGDPVPLTAQQIKTNSANAATEIAAWKNWSYPKVPNNKE